MICGLTFRFFHSAGDAVEIYMGVSLSLLRLKMLYRVQVAEIQTYS